MARSNDAISLLTAGWEMNNTSAARRIEPVSTTALNASM